MIKLELFMHGDFFGLIIPMKTGVTWTNQVGGLACHHPEVEGLYVPLPASWHAQPEMMVNMGWNVLKPHEMRSVVTMWLHQNGIDNHFRPWFGEGVRTEEAWVWVEVQPETDAAILQGLKGRLGVLTYQNSD